MLAYRFPRLTPAAISAALAVLLVAGCAAPAASPTAKPAAPAPAAAPAIPPTQAATPPPAVAAPAKPAEATKPTAAAKPAAPAPAAPSGVKQELTIAQGTDPRNLDPHVLNQQTTRNITQAVNEPLLDWDFAKSQLYGVLSTEWKLVDPTTWQFKLRPNVKFSNGEPWNADVAKYNLDRVRNPETKSGYGVYTGDIASVNVVDPMTVNVVTKAPSPLLPMNLTRIGMVPQKYATDQGLAGMAKSPIGTGPYKVTEFVPDERVVLEPNAAYWRTQPILTKVTFRPIPESAARVAALKTGRADVITLVPISDIESIKSDQNLEVLGQAGMRGMYIQINTVKYDTPLKELKVRQALNYGVDKDTLIKTVLGGYGAVLRGSIVTPGYFGYNGKLEPYPYDPAKAKQLLADAGFPNGFETSLTTTSGRYIADKELSEAVAGQLSKIGVQVKVNVKDYSIWTDDLNKGILGPLALVGLTSIPDAGSLLNFFVSGGRFGFHPTPAFDQVLKQSAQEMDPAKRADLLGQAAAVLREEANVIFLDQQFDLYAFNKKVQNLKPLADERIDFSAISVK
ncbi:MAG: hypothetical protein IT307_02815 [Chloroflexi bacterium]|nr:hypothetical protein [Chloroflexota bacterium]